jgi:addiction module RelE/StbE family toxin
MEIIFSKEFKRDFKKIRDKPTLLKVIKQIKKLEVFPESGKPLQYAMKGHRTIRVPPFRIIYRLEGNKIILVYFDHRESVYN